MEPYATKDNIDDKCITWLEKISTFNQHVMNIDPGKTALLVIDMQKFFLDPDSPSFTCGGLAVLPKIKELIESFRAKGAPVIFTRHVHHPSHNDAGIMGWWWEGMCLEGSPESEIHDDLAPLPLEKVIFKHRYSAFYNTDMETVLRCLNIKDLVITGLMTNMCCDSTARDAYFRDYRVFFPADGNGSIIEEMHLATLLNLAFGFAYVTTCREIIDQIV